MTPTFTVQQLMRSVEERDLHTFCQWLQHAPDWTHQQINHAPLVFHLIDQQQTLMVELLLERGLNLNVRNRALNTPLMQAIF